MTTTMVDLSKRAHAADHAPGAAADLSDVYAVKVAPNILGTTSDTAHFDAVQGSGLYGGFTSRVTNPDGTDAGIGIVLKPAGDTSVAPIQWANDSDNNFLAHLTLTGTATGTASLIGMGVTGTGTAVSGLIVDNRNAGTGGAFANKNTTTSTAVALMVQQSGPGVGFWAWMDTASTAADATLMKLSGSSTHNADARTLSVQNQIGQEGIYIGSNDGVLHLLPPSALRSEVTWAWSGGIDTRYYVDDGTHASFYATKTNAALGGGWKVSVGTAPVGTKGSETYSDLVNFAPAKSSFYTQLSEINTTTLDEVLLSPTEVRLYAADGGGTNFYGYSIASKATGGRLSLLALADAPKGTGTAYACLSIAAGASFGKLGLYGAAPTPQAARVGQLTDSTGGTASSTLAAGITDTVAKNAIASLAAKLNAIETALHNLGVTA